MLSLGPVDQQLENAAKRDILLINPRLKHRDAGHKIGIGGERRLGCVCNHRLRCNSGRLRCGDLRRLLSQCTDRARIRCGLGV